MRRSKSSHKEAARGFEDEITDFISQPLKSLNLFNNNQFINRLENQKSPVVVSQGLKDQKTKIYSWRHCLSQEQLAIATKYYNNFGFNESFRSKIVKEFAEGLGGDSLECYKYMYDVRSLSNKEVLAHYSKIYDELQTIPIVFLSVVKTHDKKIKAIYLWQFNELCPIDRKIARIQVDFPVRSEVYAPHSSMLLIAKFVTSESEELLDGQFLSDSRILIKSRVSGGAHLRFREYDMMDLRELVRVNPYQTSVDSRFYCASKLDISLDEVSGVNCELSRIRRTAEIELLEYHQRDAKVGKLSMYLKVDSQKISEISELSNSLFSEIYWTRGAGYTVLIDRSSAKMVLFKKDSLKIIDLSAVGQICSIYQNNTDVFYFLNSEGKVFRIGKGYECAEDLLMMVVEINIQIQQDNVKFMSVSGVDYAVYLEGVKVYTIALKKGETAQLLFEIEAKEEVGKPNIKLVWEVAHDKIVALKGNYVFVYDNKVNQLEKRELQQTELLEYKNDSMEWKLFADKSKVFAMSESEDRLRIKTVALKADQVKKSEKVFKVNDTYTNYIVGNLRKGEDSLFVRATGASDRIIFFRLEEPYIKDDSKIFTGMPCYLFSSFVYP